MTESTDNNRQADINFPGVGTVFASPLATVTSRFPGNSFAAASLVELSSTEAQALQYTDSGTTEQAA